MVMDSRLAAGLPLHASPHAGRKKSPHDLQPADAERIPQILIRPGAVAVERNAEALNAEF